MAPSARRAPIGAHVGVARGLVRGGLRRADELGAEVVQVFVGNPRGWAETPLDPVADEAFRVACAARRLPVFVHAPYLINFGSPSRDTLVRSSGALTYTLRRAAAIGASGVVLHAGSAVLGNRWADAMAQVRAHLLPLLDDAGRTGPMPRLLIEPTAGGGGALASTLPSLAAYLAVLGRDERVGVCLDTCHLHAAGHDVGSPEAMARTLRAAGRALGRRRIGLLHVNDSRDPRGSRRDRHAGLGAGTIGLAAFAALFSGAVPRQVPMVVETAEEDQARDIAALKALRDG